MKHIIRSTCLRCKAVDDREVDARQDRNFVIPLPTGWSAIHMETVRGETKGELCEECARVVKWVTEGQRDVAILMKAYRQDGDIWRHKDTQQEWIPKPSEVTEPVEPEPEPEPVEPPTTFRKYRG